MDIKNFEVEEKMTLSWQKKKLKSKAKRTTVYKTLHKYKD